ncbi:MAG: glycoside hydrolase family 16 protein, partial [Acidobacteriota bacterium]
MISVSVLLLLAAAGAPPSTAQVGSLLWEENFDILDSNRWTIDIGDGCDQGLCGWGNQELQSYGASNVGIEAVPGEPGNSALVLEARDEVAGSLVFTSGKIQSKDKVAIQYVMVEIRMRVPDLATGFWPAAWMLGTSTATWPAKGEIDIMEMGHSQGSRDRQGFGTTPINSYVGSNLIFYSPDACVPENPTCAASSSWDVSFNTPYAASVPMNDRFLIYRLYWTDTDIQFSITDGGSEHFLHATPFGIGGEADEFQAPFYFLLNLAVGGNFTDAATSGQVTAPRPGKMYVDYVRVYEYNGLGQVFTGNITPPETGTFGVFTDTTPTDNTLEAGVSSDIWVWDPTTTAGTTPPLEGPEVIAWNVQAGGWFGGGVQSRQARDMSNFADGDLRFRIKIPADVEFRVGITDTYTNENWLTFPANQTTYGLVRDGQWGEAVIPVSDLRGTLVALQSLSYLFAIAADPPASSFEMAIDDIYWQGGGASDPDSDGDGVPDSADQCAGTAT